MTISLLYYLSLFWTTSRKYCCSSSGESINQPHRGPAPTTAACVAPEDDDVIITKDGAIIRADSSPIKFSFQTDWSITKNFRHEIRRIVYLTPYVYMYILYIYIYPCYYWIGWIERRLVQSPCLSFRRSCFFVVAVDERSGSGHLTLKKIYRKKSYLALASLDELLLLSSHWTVLSTHRHHQSAVHPVSVLILHRGEIRVLWLQTVRQRKKKKNNREGRQIKC